MTREEVVALMKSYKSEKEWEKNCTTVVKAFGDYPNYWWAEIMSKDWRFDMHRKFDEESKH